MKRNRWLRLVTPWILPLLLASVLPAAAGIEIPANLPDRQIEMALEFPGVAVFLAEDVEMDVIFYNRGRSNETVDVRIAAAPDGWLAAVKNYRFDVTGLHVPANDQRTLTFRAEPPEEVKAGRYEFRIEARTPDGAFELSQPLVVTVKGKAEKKTAQGVRLTTSYPVLQGPTDGQFEFSVDVDSKLDKDAVFDLFARGPEGWDIRFKPAYESKYISSVRLKAGQSQSIAVEVKPALTAEAGEHAIQVRAGTGDFSDEAVLTVLLTGTYELEAGTANGLLSLEARQGKPANMSFYVKNTGSAVNHEIRFMSFKPENWEVAFTPERIENLPPGELKQVEVRITPYEEALVGDYSVSINVQGERADKDIELRVSVKASSAWAWIGIGIIVLAVAGLTGLFRWLGRR